MELETLLSHVKTVEDRILGIHEAHKRLENTLDVRLTQVAELVKRERIEEALHRCLQKSHLVREFAAEGAALPVAPSEPDALPLATSEPPPDEEPQINRRSSSRDASGAQEPLPEVQEDASFGNITSRRRTKSFYFQPRDFHLDAEHSEFGNSKTIWHPTGGRTATIEDRRCIKPFHPDSYYVHMYDLVIFAMMMIEAVVVPYQVAFDIPMRESLFVSSATFLAVAGWSVDLVMGFTIGAYVRGELVMDFRTIAITYLKSDFFLNLLTLALDIANIAVEYTSDGEGQQSFLRLVKIIKVSRLIRICVRVMGTKRIFSVSDRLANAVRKKGIGTQVRALSKVLWVLCLMVLVNHLGACVWRLVGEQSLENWRSLHDIESNSVNEYFGAYYNSVSLLLTSQPTVNPTTFTEILSCIIGIYFGLVVMSVLISEVATHLIDVHTANKERTEKVKVLREYLVQRRVEPEVAIPIEKQVFERLQSVKWLSEQDVTVLSILSPYLRAELSASLYGSTVGRLSLIGTCGLLESQYIRSVCSTVLQPDVYDPGHGVFEPRTEAVGAYYVSWGMCEYSLPFHSDDQCVSAATSVSNNGEPVEPGRWIAEVAIWVTWRHVGSLECTQACELLCVEAAKLGEAASNFPSIARIGQAYTRAVADALHHEELNNFSDLRNPIDYETVFTSMDMEWRRMLSKAALEKLPSTNRWGRWQGARDGMQDLSNEVAKGSCDLIVDQEGEVKRVVNVVAVRLIRDGHLLVQIAQKKDQSIVPGFKLPGTKVRGGELPADCLSRLRDGALKDFSNAMQIQNHHVVSEEKLSPSYGVNTKYMRSIFHAVVPTGASGGVLLSHRSSIISLTPGANPRPGEGRRMSGQLAMGKTKSASVRSLKSSQRAAVLNAKYQAFLLTDANDPRHASICAWMDEEEYNKFSSDGDDKKDGDVEAVAQSWINLLNIESVPQNSAHLERVHAV